MLRIHACEKCVARRICLSPRRYPRLSVSSFEKGRIPSTSQHLCRDSFHGNEDHAWHRRHNSSLKRPCPASSLRAFAKGVSLSPARVMACVAMLFTASSGTRSVARSHRRSWRPCPAACPLGLAGIPLGILCIQLSRYHEENFPPHIFIPPWKQKTETLVFKKIFAK